MPLRKNISSTASIFLNKFFYDEIFAHFFLVSLNIVQNTYFPLKFLSVFTKMNGIVWHLLTISDMIHVNKSLATLCG